MSFTFVIPDLHGRADLLDEASIRIATYSSRQRRVVLLGDYVNKGPDSCRVVELLRNELFGDVPVMALKGNHDALMVAAFRDRTKRRAWYGKGGRATLSSYGGSLTNIPAAHIDWLDARPQYCFDLYRFYVHAGVDPAVPPEDQREDVLLNKRYAAGDQGGYRGHFVVHGHDNAPNGPLRFSKRINLDACAWRTGRLVIGVFDDDKAGGPCDFIEIRGVSAA